MLIEAGYVVTNAHVVWPYAQVRVVFPDGSEFPNAPVHNWDLLGDLAVIGPLETAIEPAKLGDGETLGIGSDVYLIGYPGEVDQFPKPTLTRGLIEVGTLAFFVAFTGAWLVCGMLALDRTKAS